MKWLLFGPIILLCVVGARMSFYTHQYFLGVWDLVGAFCWAKVASNIPWQAD